MGTYGGTKLRVLPATKIIGAGVRNPVGEDLGKVEELMIDLEGGRITYAILSFGGFLGLGDKLFAIPWQALTLAADEGVYVLNVDRAVLEQAPGFDRKHWPDMSEPTFQTTVYGHYGYSYTPTSSYSPR
jgi:sporulation protein YlmC with PRC-barrel domain